MEKCCFNLSHFEIEQKTETQKKLMFSSKRLNCDEQTTGARNI